MIHLVNKLINFGFTRTDAQVYISLLKNGRSSGYKIAKEISLSRSSVYSSIDNLYNNGYIFLVDGDTMKQNLLNSYFHKLKKALLTI